MRPKVIDGRVYRLRRGRWVEVPPQWVGKVASKQTKKRRRLENRISGTGGTTIPWKVSNGGRGQDAPSAPEHWRTGRRKMLPEPVVSRRDHDRRVIEEALDDTED